MIGAVVEYMSSKNSQNLIPAHANANVVVRLIGWHCGDLCVCRRSPCD